MTNTPERLSVSVPQEIAQRLRYEAGRRSRPISSVVGDALVAYLAGQPEPALPSFVGSGASDRTDLSEHVDARWTAHLDAEHKRIHKKPKR